MSNDPSFDQLLAKRPSLSFKDDAGLVFSDVSLTQIAQKMGTPCWVINADALHDRIQFLKQAIRNSSLKIDIHYAIKANDSLSVLSLMQKEGIGGDIVSCGELKRAIKAGMSPSDLIFSGVGKKTWELEEALSNNIGQINVESIEELDMLCAIAKRFKKDIDIVLRINPDIDAGTHDHITTARKDTKFGIPINDAVDTFRRAQQCPFIHCKGFAVHIGSQIVSLTPYRKTYAVMRQLIKTCREQNLTVTSLDCGGGLGVCYKNEDALSPKDFIHMLEEYFGDMQLNLAIEPGRWLVAPCGLLLSEVILNKRHGQSHPFLIIDASMSDFIRPGMYDAWHGFLPLSTEDYKKGKTLTHIAGPVCENTDTFTRFRPFPPLKSGAYVAILDTGAYGTVMSSNYNTRPLAPEVMISHGQWHVTRKCQNYEQLWQNENIIDF